MLIEEEAGILPTATNISTRDTDPVTLPTAVTTPASPSYSELLIPLSLSLGFPPNDSFNAIERLDSFSFSFAYYYR